MTTTTTVAQLLSDSIEVTENFDTRARYAKRTYELLDSGMENSRGEEQFVRFDATARFADKAIITEVSRMTRAGAFVSHTIRVFQPEDAAPIGRTRTPLARYSEKRLREAFDAHLAAVEAEGVFQDIVEWARLVRPRYIVRWTRGDYKTIALRTNDYAEAQKRVATLLAESPDGTAVIEDVVANPALAVAL